MHWIPASMGWVRLLFKNTSLLGTVQTGQAEAPGTRLPVAAGLKQRKDCVLQGEVHLSFNPTALHISCVMSNRFLNLSEPWFLYHKMGQVNLTL